MRNDVADHREIIDMSLGHHGNLCSRDLLKTIVHGAVTFNESCSTSIEDKISKKIIKSLPKQNCSVIICPAILLGSTHTLQCLYSFHIIERGNNQMTVFNSRLTRISVAALQSEFSTVSYYYY